MAPPRAIQGSIGSRIRVILGETGNSWLLLLDHDDGNRQWQSKNWKSIPSGLAKQINNCAAKGRDINYVDFCSSAKYWYVHGVKADGSGGHCWWGGFDSAKCLAACKSVDLNPLKMVFGSQNSAPSFCMSMGGNGYECNNTSPHLAERLNQNQGRSGTVHMLRLFSDGQYYIRDDEGRQWLLSNIHLEEEVKKNIKVEDLSVAGDGSWIVIRPNGIDYSTDIDSELKDQINTFIRQQRERKKKRQREIKEYHDRLRAEREAREAAERERQEAAERAAREEEERRAEEERKRREEEERAKKAAEEESRATTLEVKLVERLTQEKESIDKLEKKLEAMQDHLEVMQDHFSTLQDDLYRRKTSLRESIVALPPAQRPRWNLGEENNPRNKRQEKPQCVICQDTAPVRAVVPCGHLCLCDGCAPSISQRASTDRLCPLCRGPATSTLRIYS